MGQAAARPRRYWMGGKRTYEQDRFFEQALEADLWQPGDAEQWDACWYTGMPDPDVFRDTGPHRKINHIPGNNALTIKSRLYETLVAMRDRLVDQYGPDHEHVARLGFLPKVFSMPHDYHALQQAALEEPERPWILKPKNAARGKGVRVVRDVAGIPLNESWMVQEYLERPHTMHGRKYVLRLYVLIASATPFRVYLYEQGFAKLASAPYDIDDPENVYSHLTNPDVNALNTDADVPVEFVDFHRYRDWLREQGHDDAALFAKIRDLVTLTTIAAVEPMRKRSRAVGADPRGCYELLGIDCLVDEDLKPWILECNLSPSMGVCAGPESGGEIEERVKGNLVADMVSLVGLNETAAESVPTDPEARIRHEAEAELARAGGFQRLYPNRDAERYLPFFALPRLPDVVLADATAAQPVQRPKLQRRHAVELITDDHVGIYEAHTGRLNRLNDSASFIWLLAMEGHDPDGIADTLLASAEEAGAPEPWPIRNEVWDCLAGWADAGLVAQRPGRGNPSGERQTPQPSKARSVRQLKRTTTAYRAQLQCGAGQLDFYTDSQPVVARLSDLLVPMETHGLDDAPRLEVVRDTPGYTLILDGEVIETRLPLAAVVPRLVHHLARRAPADDELVIDAGLALAGAEPDSAGVMFVHAQPGIGDALGLRFAQALERPFARGMRLPLRDMMHGRVLGLPAQVAADEAGALSVIEASAPCHRLLGGNDGYLRASDAMVLHAEHGIGTVVIPDRREGGESSETLRNVSVSEALSHLLPACFTADQRPLQEHALRSLADWLDLCERYVVDATDPAAAVARLRATVDAPPSMRAASRTA